MKTTMLDRMTYIGNDYMCKECSQIIHDWECRCGRIDPQFPLPKNWVEVAIFVVEEG